MVKERIYQMQTWEYIKTYVDEKLEETKEDYLKKIKSSVSFVTRKIDDLHDKHLIKEGFIGEDEKCAGKTLIDYVHAKMPENIRKIRENHEHIEATT